MLVSKSEMEEFTSLVVVKSIVETCLRIWLTVSDSSKMMAVLSASIAVTPQAFLPRRRQYMYIRLAANTSRDCHDS